MNLQKINVECENSFLSVVKKLHKNQKLDLDKAVRDIMNNPTIGELKKGDLKQIRVYKFKICNQLYLLAYTYSDDNLITVRQQTVTLIKLGTHANFYNDLKKYIRS